MKATTEVPEVYPIIIPTSISLKSFNFYLVKSKGTLMLVDSGIDTEKCWNAFNRVLTENGWNIADIDKIILTHNHNDHTGLVNRIRSEKSIPVYAHPKAIVRLKRNSEFMQTRISFFRKLYKEMGCGERGEQQIEKLKRAMEKNKKQAIKGEILTIEEGEVIEGFRVVAVPGHAPDHIALFHPETGIFVGGDHLIKHISSNALIEPDQQGKKIFSLFQYEESLKKCRKYPLTVVYPGHGEMVKNPIALIDERIKGIQTKSEKVKQIIQEKPLTAAQVAQIFYKEKYEREFSLVMSEVIGHLDRLESLNEIGSVLSDDVYYYLSRSE